MTNLEPVLGVLFVGATMIVGACGRSQTDQPKRGEPRLELPEMAAANGGKKPLPPDWEKRCSEVEARFKAREEERRKEDPAAGVSSASCRESGGVPSLYNGVNYSWQCLPPATDRGKYCTSSEQCEGDCVPPPGAKLGDRVRGTCSEGFEYGCTWILVNGIVQFRSPCGD
jgi:hypothetical protein